MAGVNKVIIVGNLGSVPEFKLLPNGDAVASISVATSESWTDQRTGEKREAVEWHRVIFYRRLAEIVRDYLGKGSKVYVEGRLKTRKWEDNQGVERYVTEIIAEKLQMLGGHETIAKAADKNVSKNNAYAKAKNGTSDSFADDPPF